MFAGKPTRPKQTTSLCSVVWHTTADDLALQRQGKLNIFLSMIFQKDECRLVSLAPQNAATKVYIIQADSSIIKLAYQHPNVNPNSTYFS